MTRQWRYLAILGIIVPALAVAQERPRVPPPGEDRVRERTMTITPEIDRIYYLSINRGKMGITVNIRPAPTDSVGALVDAVSPGSPAFKAGIRSGDLITRFNGRSVPALARETRRPSPGMALIDLASALGAGDTARVEYRRGASRGTVAMVLEPVGDFPQQGGRLFDRLPAGNEGFGARPWDFSQPGIGVFDGPGDEPAFFLPFRSMADLELAPMNPGLGQYFGVSTGVLVIRAPEHTTLNLRSGDVVTLVDGRRVSSPNHEPEIQSQ
jgi:hypothetical protein